MSKAKRKKAKDHAAEIWFDEGIVYLETASLSMRTSMRLLPDDAESVAAQLVSAAKEARKAGTTGEVRG